LEGIVSNSVDFPQARQYFDVLQRVVTALPYDGIERIAEILIEAYESRRMVYMFGNGGSAALASHFACDLGKGTAYCNGGKRFRVLALTDNLPMLTAWANDSHYEDIFAEQLQNFVQAHDVAFAISGGGNSKNVLKALRVARSAGATTVGISGFQGGEMKSLCDICVIIPSTDMQIIEDLHLAAAHSIYRIVLNRISSHTLAASGPR
jgi:D-sedoheptulose 7-phosphate isomerase